MFCELRDCARTREHERVLAEREREISRLTSREEHLERELRRLLLRRRRRHVCGTDDGGGGQVDHSPVSSDQPADPEVSDPWPGCGDDGHDGDDGEQEGPPDGDVDISFSRESPLKAKAYMVAVNKVVISERLSTFVEALHMMFYSYYIHNMDYPVEIWATMEFLQRCINKLNPKPAWKVEGQGAMASLLLLLVVVTQNPAGSTEAGGETGVSPQKEGPSSSREPAQSTLKQTHIRELGSSPTEKKTNMSWLSWIFFCI
ncbi:hypothetical protein CRUP_031292 [Coryphaenoides rupestris]|nr:hypothetical protein CRUP_031292 [Coryphaenoides rupestris]